MATNTNEREEIKPVAPTEQTKWRDPSLVGKYMVDPKTGLAGLFRSPDNGETWVLTDTVYGHVYNQDEVDNIWDNGAGHKVADEIKSATADLPNVRKQADSAVKFAESAIAASKVNSDAIVAQSSAVVEAKSAMDSATAEIQQLKANAASDVAQIRADVAQVQNEVDTAKAANSASVDKLKSDIGLAQKDLDNVHDSLTKAQSAVEQNQKLINDSVAKINSDIAQSRQDIVTAQQANNDLAKQLDTYSKEAQEQGKTIKTIQDNQDGFSITIADVKGDVTKVSDTVDGLSAGLKDAQGNIASVKAQADQLNATLTDHSKDIAQLTATAKELSSTLEDADGRLSKVEQTASEQSTTLSDLQGNLTQVKQTADNLVTTLKDAQGNIDQIKQDAKGTLEQLSNVQGDITALQTDVSGIKLTIADHEKNIHTLQVDSKTLKDDMADAKGNISSLQKTSTSLVSEFKDHDGRLSKIEQTATEHTSELADAKGNIDKVTQKADSLEATLTDAQKDINSIKVDASGIHEALTGQGKQITTINATLDGLNTKYEGVSDDLSKLSGTVATNSTQIDQDKKLIALKADQTTVDNLSGEVSQNKAQLKVQADQISFKVSSEDFKTLDNKVGGAIAQIDKNTTAIDQTNKQISLKADQTEVDKVKGTASQNSSRIDVMANEIKQKVDGTTVNNILDSKGYATMSYAQTLVKQTKDQWNVTATDLDTKIKDKDGINLLTGTADFTGNWFRCDDASWTDDNWRDTNGNRVRKRSGSAWNGLGQTVHLEPGNYTFSMDMFLNLGTTDTLNFYAGDTQYNGTPNIVQLIDGNHYDHNSPQGSWFRAVCHFKVTEAGSVAIRPELNQDSGTVHVGSYKLEKGLIATPWTPAPSDNASVTQISSLQVSIDGIQGNVNNLKNDTSSRITQLSNTFQSKIGDAQIAINDLKDKTLWTSTDSIDLNNAVSQQKIFVKGGSNLPPGSYWWYVRVEPGYASRIVQYAVSDRDNLHYSRQYDGSKWSAWSQGATESEITQLRDDINLRVKSGDLLSQINIQAGRTLIQSQKIYMDADSVIMGPNTRAFIPSAAIVSLDADKINTGTLNTQMVSIGDDQTRLWARSNYLYLTGKDQGDAYNMRIGGDKIEFVTTEIPNNAPYLDGITPMYTIEYNGDAKARLKVRSFNRLTGSNEFPVEMYDSVNISKDELDFAANNQMKMQVNDSGVNIKPTLFFQNNTNNGTYAGFTRLDNSDIVEFNTGNNNGENFHVNSGAHFMQYVYINGYARAQGWLTNSALSKKMNIRKLDLQTALDKIRQDDQYLYEYKRNVAQGIHDPQASFIIDDVHDVAHYSVPREFIDQTGKYREPNVELAYLIAAFQAIDKQVQAQQAEIKALKEQLNNEQ